MMPSYVNIGARVGANTMVDTWVTVGSCALVFLAAGALALSLSADTGRRRAADPTTGAPSPQKPFATTDLAELRRFLEDSQSEVND